MTACLVPPQTIDATIVFHGHSCPGLVIGIRAAELALRALDNPPNAELVAITETDLCPADAIQFLTGCTFGKGNLIHRDHGKMVFSFFDRRSSRGLRLALRPDAWGPDDGVHRELMRKVAAGTAGADEKVRLQALRADAQRRLLSLDLDEVFEVTDLDDMPPKHNRLEPRDACAGCGEATARSRTRDIEGRAYCIPCHASIATQGR